MMGVRRRVRVLLSVMSDSPSVVGWLRPVILLPAATLAGLTPLQLEAILAHEIGHIRRHDYLVNILQMVVETMLFYHPAVWWTSKRIRLERELCCDDLAVQFSGNALRYARALTTLEKLRLRTPAIAMASTGGPLLYRIQRLVGVAPKECGGSRLPIIVAASLGVLCLALNAPWIGAQDAPGVKVDLGASSVIHRAPVPYPEAARKQKITGTVQIEVKLDSTGNVADARVLTGPEELRKTALQSVLNWHFTSDAARGTRLVTIEFSEQGTGVQVTEPLIAWAVEADALKLVELKKKVEALAEVKGGVAVFEPTDHREAELIERRRKLEIDAVEIQKKLSEATKAQVTNEDASSMQRKLLEVKKALDTTRIAAVENSGRNPAGGVLSVINMPGFSDSVRNELLARLPIRIGDTISSQSIEQISQAVRSYDEHLRAQFVANADGQIELRIVSSSERR
jgi:TonB family protein